MICVFNNILLNFRHWRIPNLFFSYLMKYNKSKLLEKILFRKIRLLFQVWTIKLLNEFLHFRILLLFSHWVFTLKSNSLLLLIYQYITWFTLKIGSIKKSFKLLLFWQVHFCKRGNNPNNLNSNEKLSRNI